MIRAKRGLTPIALEDLPKYTDWPKRLLSLESFAVKYKTEKEVLREFNQDKWGQLLKQVRGLTNPTLVEIERGLIDVDTLMPCYDMGGFYLATERQLLDMHLDLFADVLRPHLDGASCLVELGAGYGSKLLALGQREGFSALPLLAGEYTQSGRELISILADSLNKSMAVGYCDFREMKIDGLRIPEDAVIFTSYAAHYVPELSKDFVGFLSKLNPRAVVHFEPCYELYAMDSLHGMMCRRYAELNDYTRNLASIIEAGQERGEISVRTRKNVLGSNPFLPISVIEWAPVGRSKVLV
ncbi:MAG: hypothetical protein V4614_09055 [Pseudomonadota bacterium]